MHSFFSWAAVLRNQFKGRAAGKLVPKEISTATFRLVHGAAAAVGSATAVSCHRLQTIQFNSIFQFTQSNTIQKINLCFYQIIHDSVFINIWHMACPVEIGKELAVCHAPPFKCRCLVLYSIIILLLFNSGDNVSSEPETIQIFMDCNRTINDFNSIVIV